MQVLALGADITQLSGKDPVRALGRGGDTGGAKLSRPQHSQGCMRFGAGSLNRRGASGGVVALVGRTCSRAEWNLFATFHGVTVRVLGLRVALETRIAI